MPLLSSITEKQKTRERNPKQEKDEENECENGSQRGMNEIFIAYGASYHYSSGCCFISRASNQ
jgi:hypothetical protein